MKQIKYLTIVLLLAGGMASCNENKGEYPWTEIINLPEKMICGVENPLTDLPWLESFIISQKQYGKPFRIWIYTYRVETTEATFFVAIDCHPNIDCERKEFLISCEGTILCLIGFRESQLDFFDILYYQLPFFQYVYNP